MSSAEDGFKLDATTRMAIGCIIAAVAFELIAVGMMAGQEPQAVGHPVLFGCVGVLGLGVLLASVCSFLIWFHRAYRRLEVLEVGNRRYSATWAVLGWFIPFLNLVRPYHVAVEIWERTDSYVRLEQDDLLSKPEPTTLVTFWWISFLAANILPSLFSSLGPLDESEVLLPGGLLRLAAGIAVIQMILKIERKQQLALSLAAPNSEGVAELQAP